jgi:pimeloyl-ACP methyl ester carboxylesterase
MTSEYVELCGKEVHLMAWSPAAGWTPSSSASACDGGATVTHAIMWHGFARTCRDFDALAAHVATTLGVTVLCPDTIGRGLSEWTTNLDEYGLPFYLQQLTALLQLKGITACYFVGTSMGGLLGMVAAATSLKGVIRKLVLNDVGPVVEQAALERIMAYLSNPPVCATATAFEAATAETYKSFGPMPTATRRQLAEACTRRLPDGQITTHLDPNVVAAIKPMPPGTTLWPLYDLITCPTFVVRGETSDVLSPSTLAEMATRGPKATSCTVPLTGHAPLMADRPTMEVVSAFLALPVEESR